MLCAALADQGGDCGACRGLASSAPNHPGLGQVIPQPRACVCKDLGYGSGDDGSAALGDDPHGRWGVQHHVEANLPDTFCNDIYDAPVCHTRVGSDELQDSYGRVWEALTACYRHPVARCGKISNAYFSGSAQNLLAVSDTYFQDVSVSMLTFWCLQITCCRGLLIAQSRSAS